MEMETPEVRGSFGPRETFYLVFAGVAGVLLLVLTVRDAAGGVVGGPAVGLVLVAGLIFLIVFGGSDRQDRDPGAGGPAEDPEREGPGAEPPAPGAERPES